MQTLFVQRIVPFKKKSWPIRVSSSSLFRGRFAILSLFFMFFFSSVHAQDSLLKLIESLPDASEDQFLNMPVPQNVPVLENVQSIFQKSIAGISEPLSDSSMAIAQAYIRALCLLALQKGESMGVSDFFNQELSKIHVNSKYEEFFILKSTLSIASNAIKVSTPVFLKSGEAIVSIELDTTLKNNKHDHIKVETEIQLYHNEVYSNYGLEESVYRTELKVKLMNDNEKQLHTDKLSFTLINNRWQSKTCEFDQKIIEQPSRLYFYQLPGILSAQNKDDGLKMFNTYYGLWNPLISALFWNLTLDMKEHLKKVKNLTESYSGISTTLNRESGKYKYLLNYKGCSLNENRLVSDSEVVFW